MKTIVGLFDNFGDAQQVVTELERAGFSHDRVSIVANQNATGYSEAVADDPSAGERVAHGVGDAAKGAVKGGVIGGLTGLAASIALAMVPGVGPVLAAGPLAATLGGATLGATAGGLIGGLTGLGVPESEAHHYSEGVRRGGTLVTVQADDMMADQAVAILNRYNPVDIEQRGNYHQSTGFTGYSADAQPFTSEDISRDRETYATYSRPAMNAAAATTASNTTHTPSTAVNASATRDVAVGEHVSVPIVEEQIQVGKREVQGGTARIHTHVTERPVEETVTLHEEHVTVQRNPVNRVATDADLSGALQDRTIEVTERSEEAVVAKQARVVEEVVIGKEASERTETIRDTVRRTDVDVEELNADDVSTTTTASTTTTSGTTGRSNY